MPEREHYLFVSSHISFKDCGDLCDWEGSFNVSVVTAAQTTSARLLAVHQSVCLAPVDAISQQHHEELSSYLVQFSLGLSGEIISIWQTKVKAHGQDCENMFFGVMNATSQEDPQGNFAKNIHVKEQILVLKLKGQDQGLRKTYYAWP